MAIGEPAPTLAQFQSLVARGKIHYFIRGGGRGGASGATSRPRNQGSPRPVLPGVGDVAPDFELPDHEGRHWGLADHLKNRPVVLVFYRGDW